MSNLPAKFKDYRFGYASAEVEGESEPQLLLDGYCDPHGVIRKALRERHFLFLGYKGSGKSAIAEHLRLSAEQDPLLFAKVMYLSDFPYTAFGKIVSGDAEPESKYPTAWQWLLLIALLASFERDEGGETVGGLSMSDTIKFLQRAALYPVNSLKQLALISSKKSFKAKVPGFLEGKIQYHHPGRDVEISQITQYLLDLVLSFRSDSRHVILLDGLDDILSARDIQYQSLAALLLAAQRLNTELRKRRIDAKVIILCRTDLFEKLPGANKNKIRRDLAVHLDWYEDPRRPGTSALFRLATQRARLVAPTLKSILAHFPPRIDGRTRAQFLLDLTRHTPRDFLQLLNSIQQFSSSRRLSRQEILSGLRSYSLDYFLPEIKDELVGYLTPDHIDSLFIAIGALRSRDFSYTDLLKAAKDYSELKRDVVHDGARALFECSAIGNIQNRPDGRTFFTFRYRNRNSAMSLNERFMLHRGVWKALNLI